MLKSKWRPRGRGLEGDDRIRDVKPLGTPLGMHTALRGERLVLSGTSQEEDVPPPRASKEGNPTAIHQEAR